MSESSTDVIKRYLERAAAIEKAFGELCHEFASNMGQTPAGKVFVRCLETSRRDHQRLSERLELLGTTSAPIADLFAHLFSHRSGTEILDEDLRLSPMRQLIIGFAAQNSGVAFHEAFASMAEAAGDPDTQVLVRSIQRNKREAAEEIWHLLSSTQTVAIPRDDTSAAT